MTYELQCWPDFNGSVSAMYICDGQKNCPLGVMSSSVLGLRIRHAICGRNSRARTERVYQRLSNGVIK